MTATTARTTLAMADGVASLRLNRPRAGNAIDPAMAASVDDALRRVEDTDGVRAVLRISFLFLPTVPFFWMLFDQKGSTWVLQARNMEHQVGPFKFDPSQMQHGAAGRNRDDADGPALQGPRLLPAGGAHP